MNQRALMKVARHGNSAMIALPRPILFHLDCLYGDYVLLVTNDDGSVTIRKGEHNTVGGISIGMLPNRMASGDQT